MGLKNTSSEFGSLAKWLHWLIALGIFALIYFGLEQAGMDRGPQKQEVRALHSSIALVVLSADDCTSDLALDERSPGAPRRHAGLAKTFGDAGPLGLIHCGIRTTVIWADDDRHGRQPRSVLQSVFDIATGRRR